MIARTAPRLKVMHSKCRKCRNYNDINELIKILFFVGIRNTAFCKYFPGVTKGSALMPREIMFRKMKLKFFYSPLTFKVVGVN